MAGPPTTLVVNADDFGLSAGINRGIESAFCEGILRSTSLMPNGAAFDDAVRIAGENPGLGVGIHISLVDERPVSDPKKLRGLVCADGFLPRSYGKFIKGLLLGRFSKAEIRAEIEAQVARVLDAGIAPTHIDSHQHLHILPGVLDVVLGTARATGICIVRVPSDLSPMQGSLMRRTQTRGLVFLSRRSMPNLRQRDIKFADHFHGLGVSGSMDETNLAAALSRLRPGVNEVMCHPGISDPETATRYQWGYHWDEEHTALVSPSIRQNVEDRGIRLAGFADAWL